MQAQASQVEKVMYSIEETAQALGISSRHVYRLVYDGTLPVKRIGRRVLVSRRALEVWAEQVDEVG